MPMTHKTMEDFARSCGVSRPTLSKYFDDPTSVKPATRKRIEEALRSSDYQPNLFARNLNRKRTRSHRHRRADGRRSLLFRDGQPHRASAAR